MTAVGTLDALHECEKSLQLALQGALNAANELAPSRARRAQALADHIEDAQALCARIAMYARADALTDNRYAFSGQPG